jgi:hypothetical protein
LDVYLASEKLEKVFTCGYTPVYDTHGWSAEETSSALTAFINMTRLTCCVDCNETFKNDACGVTESNHVDEVCPHLTDSQRFSLRKRINKGNWAELKQVASSSHTHLTAGDRLLDFNDVVIVKSDPGTDQLEGYVMQPPDDSHVQYECIYRFRPGVCRGVHSDDRAHNKCTSTTNGKFVSEHSAETALISVVVILTVIVVALVSGIVIYCCFQRRRQRQHNIRQRQDMDNIRQRQDMDNIRQRQDMDEETRVPLTHSHTAATNGASDDAAEADKVPTVTQL